MAAPLSRRRIGMTVSAGRPLDNFPLVRTDDCEQVRAALARVYAKPTLHPAPGIASLDARLNECVFQTTWLSYVAYGRAVSLEFPAAEYFLQLLPIRGSGEIVRGRRRAPLSDGKTGAAISPGMGYRASYSEDYEVLVLKIAAAALTRKLAAMTGASIDAPLQIELQPGQSRRMVTLYRYLPRLAEILSESSCPMPSWWVSQTEQLLMVMFLCGHRHNYSHLLEQEAPDCAPWQVRRAEDYIEANWQDGVTLEALAEVTGVSGFSLFRSFKMTRGYSPFEYASRMRSKRAGHL